MTELKWLDVLINVGPPIEKYAKEWCLNNPSAGWCGGVTRALKILNKIPFGYKICRQKDDPHYYFINPGTNEVIDLTIYQMKNEYEHDYLDYKTDNLFNDEAPENVIRLVTILKNIQSDLINL
ncbi:MAG: hypothetical protein KF816_06525 [Melioribacteraceae bacterium]|nr:hypothetical protein [Melioribacteraceae bacterium]